MISFSTLGKNGLRLGNQLFQYAFLRTQAEQLRVDFYCPHWIGDDIFSLKDHKIRSVEPTGIRSSYSEIYPLKDYDRQGVKIMDGTEIFGVFESEKNFDTQKARQWYVFNENKIARAREKYKHIDFSESVGIHLRLGDKRAYSVLNRIFFIPRIFYYTNALKCVKHTKTILIFSDEPEKAKKYFSKLSGNKIFVSGNEDWEDLYLMSQCYDFICGSSTMSWWGAWLIGHQDKTIIFPKEGLFRPGAPWKNSDLIPDGWIKIRGSLPLIDYYSLYYISPDYLKYFMLPQIGSIIRIKIPFLYKLLKSYFLDKK